jgi:hypothetical protein
MAGLQGEGYRIIQLELLGYMAGLQGYMAGLQGYG